MLEEIINLLCEDINETPPEDEVYNKVLVDVTDKTDNFTKESGIINYDDLKEALIAQSIIKEYYPNVNIKNLVDDNDYDLKYHLVYSSKIGESLESDKNICPLCRSKALSYLEKQGDYSLFNCDDCGAFIYVDKEGNYYAENELEWSDDGQFSIKESKKKKKKLDFGLGGLTYYEDPISSAEHFNAALDVGLAPSSGDMAGGMCEDIEKHTELNPKLWENGELKEEVKEVLQKVVDKYIESLKGDNIDLNIKDIIISGSNANYNYTSDSDIDLHIIADLSDLGDKQNLTELLYNAYRRIFDYKYDPEIKGLDVELSVEPYGATNQTLKAPGVSNGEYSLINGWLKQPEVSDLPDEVDLEPELSNFEKEADNLETIEDIDNFIDTLYKLRQDSLLKEGEYSKGNLIFKELRNKGIIKGLKDKKIKLENTEMTLE